MAARFEAVGRTLRAIHEIAMAPTILQIGLHSIGRRAAATRSSLRSVAHTAYTTRFLPEKVCTDPLEFTERTTAGVRKELGGDEALPRLEGCRLVEQLAAVYMRL